MENEEQQTKELDLTYKNKKEIAKGGVLGAFIGLAIIVPGVSGSTIAIIFRLYEKLLFAISNIFKKFKACFLFLLPIIIGAILGVVLGFIGVKELLAILPFATVLLFAGLMIGSFPSVVDQVKNEKKTPLRFVLFAIGLIIPIAISVCSIFLQPEATLTNIPWYYYLLFLVLGYVVSITQLVPGLSASAILMMIGYFTPLIESISFTYWKENPMIFLVYGCLAIGFLIGLFTVSKVMSHLLKTHRGNTFCVIVGLSLGSIITMFINPEIYATYTSWRFSTPMEWVDLFLGFLFLAIGITVSYLLVRYERKHGLTEEIK